MDDTILDLIEERKTLLATAEAHLKDEDTSEFDAALKRAGSLQDEISRRQSLAQAQSVQSEPVNPAADRPTSTPGAPVDAAADDQPEMRISAPRLRTNAFKGRDAERNAYASGQWFRSIRGVDTVRRDEARQWCRDNGVEYRVMSEGTNTAGGYLVPDPLAEAIIDLVEDYGVARSACQVFPMSADSLRIPRQTSQTTASWISEATSITAADAAFDQVTLTARKLASLTRISTELAEDAQSVNVADWLAMDMARRFAEAEDDAWINGDGTSTYGGIFGVKGRMDANEAYAGVVTAASGNDTYAEVTVADLAATMAALPTYAAAGARWYVSQVGRALMFERLGQQGGGTSVVTIANGLTAAYSGWPITVTQKMSTSQGDLSEATMAVFGDMKLACAFGDRRSISVKVLEELYAGSDEIGIQATERIDINAHSLGDASNAGAIVGLMGD